MHFCWHIRLGFESGQEIWSSTLGSNAALGRDSCLGDHGHSQQSAVVVAAAMFPAVIQARVPAWLHSGILPHPRLPQDASEDSAACPVFVRDRLVLPAGSIFYSCILLAPCFLSSYTCFTALSLFIYKTQFKAKIITNIMTVTVKCWAKPEAFLSVRPEELRKSRVCRVSPDRKVAVELPLSILHDLLRKGIATLGSSIYGGCSALAPELTNTTLFSICTQTRFR